MEKQNEFFRAYYIGHNETRVQVRVSSLDGKLHSTISIPWENDRDTNIPSKVQAALDMTEEI